MDNNETIYIRFLSKPGRDVRFGLKMNGFRWDGERWRAPRTRDSEEFANSMKRHGAITEIRSPEMAAVDLDYMLGY